MAEAEHDAGDVAPRPVAVWLLQLLLAVFIVTVTIALLQAIVSIHVQAVFPREPLHGVVAVGWPIGLMVALVFTIVGVHRASRSGRWLGIAVIATLAALILIAPDGSQYANDAQRAGGSLARHVLVPLLFAGWIHAFGFSRKAKRYFRGSLPPRGVTSKSR